MKHLFIIVAVSAVFCALFFKGHDRITGKDLVLHHDGAKIKYDIEPASAPVATGRFLSMLSYLFTQTRFGPSFMRLLLDMNKISRLRELASQVTLPPLYFPVRRFNKEELDSYYRDYDENSFQMALQNGPSHGHVLLQNPHGLKTIEEYANHYRSGKELPSVLLKKTLQTVRDWEKKGFRIFATMKEEDVLRQAYESDKRIQAGKPLSILDGVPIAFKDSIDVEGYSVFNGQSPKEEYKDFFRVAERDDIMVARFREQGAIILGLTIMIEGGVTPVGYSAHFQGPYSAYSWNRYSGGSSSGSAVAVATGLVPLAIGFDGGGSVRLPSTMSGVHGLAVGFGRVPFESDVDSTLIKPGPIAASSADVAIGYMVMSQMELNHFYAQLYDGGVRGQPKPHLGGYHATEDLSDVRIGIYKEWFNDADPHILKRCYEVIDYLKSKGATMVEIEIPHLGASHLAHGVKISNEFALTFDRAYHANPSG
jgi:Asp-tRNA(Asn)/Glu-tRNA(Gln) amidotransferase A subunit family amidase